MMLAKDPALAVDESGSIVVVWAQSEPNEAEEILARRLNAGTGIWEELGVGSASGEGISNTGSGSTFPVVAVRSGAVVAAWQDLGIFVSYLEAGSWRGYGPTGSDGSISNDRAQSTEPSLAFGPDGRPVVVWNRYVRGSVVQISGKRYDGFGWSEIGPGSASGGVSNTMADSARDPKLVVDDGGRPVVAFQNSSTGTNTYVRGYDESSDSWEEVGFGSASGNGVSGLNSSFSPSLAAGPDGQLSVAWIRVTSGANSRRNLFLKRWTPTSNSWVDVDTNTYGVHNNSSGDVFLPSVAINASGEELVAFVDKPASTTHLVAKKHDGASSWVSVGPRVHSGVIQAPSLALLPDGTPIVVWHDNEIYVRRFDEGIASWVEMGTDSATGGGISNSGGAARWPSLVVDSSGNPVVAWMDASSGFTQIYVRRFNSTSSTWDEVHAGSASGGGVSNSAAGSSFPSLAAGDGMICVAWQEPGAQSVEIVMRCAH